MAAFLAVPFSNPFRSYILSVQWLGGDVGSGNTAEGEVGSTLVDPKPVHLQLHLLCSSALLGASGADHFQGALPRLLDSAGFQLGSAGRRDWMEIRGREEKLCSFSFPLSVLGGFSSGSCLSSQTPDPT